MPLYASIVYEDDDILIINKSSGIEVYITASCDKIKDDNIVSFLSKHYSRFSKNNLFLVHRLDKYTSGIVIIAKNKESQRFLEDEFKKHLVEKTYHAILKGYVHEDKNTINQPIGKDRKEPNKRKILSVKNGGQKAITEYKVLKRKNDHSLVLLKPKTGRTHQLRVHCAYIGYPIIGDRIYSFNAKEYKMKGFALIAKCISFKHPKTKKIMKFSIDYDKEFTKMLEKFDLGK